MRATPKGSWHRRIQEMLCQHSSADAPTHAEHEMMCRLEGPIYFLIREIVEAELDAQARASEERETAVARDRDEAIALLRAIWHDEGEEKWPDPVEFSRRVEALVGKPPPSAWFNRPTEERG